ncbi:MAG: zf-HC2 domain-containing protein [Granulicella sp.]
MNHKNANDEMAVERYLLGELTGTSRDRFEEHLFDCAECTADLKQGVLFLEASRADLKSRGVVRESDRVTPKKPVLLTGWLLKPWILVPALAACLAVIVYQSAILQPHLRSELAELQTPAVINPLVLANAGARGGSTDLLAKVVAPRHGSYLLSVDIPPAAGVSGYRCSLYSSGGALIWHLDISPQQAHDAVTIQVPTMMAAGIRELRVQGISSSGAPEGGLIDLARYRYELDLKN